MKYLYNDNDMYYDHFVTVETNDKELFDDKLGWLFKETEHSCGGCFIVTVFDLVACSSKFVCGLKPSHYPPHPPSLSKHKRVYCGVRFYVVVSNLSNNV